MSLFLTPPPLAKASFEFTFLIRVVAALACPHNDSKTAEVNTQAHYYKNMVNKHQQNQHVLSCLGTERSESTREYVNNTHIRLYAVQVISY